MAWEDIVESLQSGGIAQAGRGERGPGEIDWNLISTLLGRSAQAVMGEFQESPQAQFGKLGAEMGQLGTMGIRAEERGRKERDAWSELVRAAFGGKGLTAEGVSGPTKIGTDASGKVTITGNAPREGFGIEPIRMKPEEELTSPTRSRLSDILAPF